MYHAGRSLPLRKCGLKYGTDSVLCFLTAVTSLAEVWIEIPEMHRRHCPISVTSLAEVWIEIRNVALKASGKFVTSLAEVWIEILVDAKLRQTLVTSLPLRKCGLKYGQGQR